jgi:hypothetical protein
MAVNPERMALHGGTGAGPTSTVRRREGEGRGASAVHPGTTPSGPRDPAAQAGRPPRDVTVRERAPLARPAPGDAATRPSSAVAAVCVLVVVVVVALSISGRPPVPPWSASPYALLLAAVVALAER